MLSAMSLTLSSFLRVGKLSSPPADATCIGAFTSKDFPSVGDDADYKST